MRRISIFLVGAALAGMATACGSSSSSSGGGYGAPAAQAPSSSTSSMDMPSMDMSSAGGAAGGASGKADAVTIKSFAFVVPASVARGARLSVTNDDDVAHTFTAKNGRVFSVNVAAHATVQVTAPKAAGRYDIVCDFHPNMHGVLVVK